MNRNSEPFLDCIDSQADVSMGLEMGKGGQVTMAVDADWSPLFLLFTHFYYFFWEIFEPAGPADYHQLKVHLKTPDSLTLT